MSIRAFWPRLLAAVLILGIATSFSPYAGGLAALYIGIYLTIRLWFINHPLTWRYDATFWVTLAGVAILGAVVYAGICAVLPAAGITTRSCRTLGFERAVWLHLWMIAPGGGVLWLYARLKFWWGARCG
jgi:hypothetical protein